MGIIFPLIGIYIGRGPHPDCQTLVESRFFRHLGNPYKNSTLYFFHYNAILHPISKFLSKSDNIRGFLAGRPKKANWPSVGVNLYMYMYIHNVYTMDQNITWRENDLAYYIL